MTRKQSQLRRVQAGGKKVNYKSKTSPSAVKRMAERRSEQDIGRLYPRIHRMRNAVKASLILELGLPRDSTFIFRNPMNEKFWVAAEKIIRINRKTVVVINRKTLELVVAVRCTKFEDMSPDVRSSFDNSISTTFLHARSRIQCMTNGASKVVDGHKGCFGWMGCCGWRGGSDKGKSAGPYSVSDFTGAQEGRLQTDRERMAGFHKIRDFWATCFSSLCLSAFKSNLDLGTTANVPGFDDVKWQDTPSGQVFASNLAVSCEGFYNKPHKDNDATRYAFGMFSRIDSQTGLPYQLGGNINLGDIKGARFVIGQFGIELDFDALDGVFEVVWDSKVKHYSTPSQAFDASGQPISHKDCKMTRYGSSCQIAKTLVNRIRILQAKKEGKTKKEWKLYVAERIKTYEEAISFKEVRLAARRFLQKEAAEAKKKGFHVKTVQITCCLIHACLSSTIQLAVFSSPFLLFSLY